MTIEELDDRFERTRDRIVGFIDAAIDACVQPREFHALIGPLITVREQAFAIIPGERWDSLRAKARLILVRLKVIARTDKLLMLATLVAAVVSIVSLAQVLEAFPAIIRTLFSLIGSSLIGTSRAAVDIPIPTAITPKDVVRYLVLAVISVGFFVAFAILTFSNKADARKLAADMIKMILGFYIGMATKLVD
jgi:hypothetical protein